MNFPPSRFLFATCQVGAEATLKEEVSRLHPWLHSSYSRPGFITFKKMDDGDIPPDFKLNSIFARAYSLSLKRVASESEAVDFFREILCPDSGGEKGGYQLHVWERDRWAPGDAPKDAVTGVLASKVETAIRSGARAGENELFALSGEPVAGEWVLDVVCVEENEIWLGAHRHSEDHSPDAGGAPVIQLPEDAPSRAYLKLEEGVRWSNAPLKRGDIAVEIGSAPGGASYALLKRGLKVVGIDPAEMDPRVMAMSGFKHIRKPVASVPREDLPSEVHWLLLDMNVTPHLTIFQVDRLGTRLRDSLLGVLLTVKLNDWKIAREIPYIFDHLKAMGMSRVRGRQLATNKQEVFVFGLTHLGLMRRDMAKREKVRLAEVRKK